MYTAIKGIYENGVLRLLEPAPNVKRSEVVITFLNEEGATAKMARRPGGRLRLQKNKGKHFDIPGDFNDPIDDRKDYMYRYADTDAITTYVKVPFNERHPDPFDRVIIACKNEKSYTSIRRR